MAAERVLPAPARYYIAAVAAISGAIVASSLWSLFSGSLSRHEIAWLVGSTIFIAAATARPIELGPHVRLSVATAPQLMAAILLGPMRSAVAAGVGVTIGFIYHIYIHRRSDITDLLFNTGQSILSTLSAAVVYNLVSLVPLGTLGQPVSLLVSAESIHLINTLLVSGAIALSGQSAGFTQTFPRLLRADLLQYAALLVTGIVGALLARQAFWAVPLLVAPLALVERMLMKQREEEERNRQLAVMEQVNHLKNDFIAAVTHDLRTPLMVVKGFGELLAEREDELLEDERQAIDAINLNTERLAELIEMLLQMSELDAGMVVLRRASVDVPVVARRVLDEVRYHAEQKGVAVKLDVRGAVPPIAVDAARIEQVIANLVNNAIKFTPASGHVTVTVESDDAALVLQVADTGLGISPETLPHIFDRFYRARHVDGDRRQTGGLGLSIAKGIVELHGGAIAVESQVDEGSTFTVRLPRLVVHDTEDTDHALAGMLRPARPLPNAR